VSDHQPLLQIGTPLRETDPAYVILRLEDSRDIDTAQELLNGAAEKLAPLMVGVADTVSRLLRSGVGNVTGQLQQAGLAPVLTQAPAQPVYQGPTVTSQVAMPQAQPTSSLLTGPCWAASPRKMHNAECKDCGQPTYLTTKTLRSGKVCNAHVCSDNPQHKITWCEDLIWNSKVVEANGRGIGTDPGLVTG
jgi:hypothetical protein